MPHNGVDADPWGSQAVLTNRESGLLVSQQTQRGVVSDANEQARCPSFYEISSIDAMRRR